MSSKCNICGNTIETLAPHEVYCKIIYYPYCRLNDSFCVKIIFCKKCTENLGLNKIKKDSIDISNTIRVFKLKHKISFYNVDDTIRDLFFTDCDLEKTFGKEFIKYFFKRKDNGEPLGRS